MFYEYARTSTKDQAKEEKTSIGEQLRKCHAIAVMRGCNNKYDCVEVTDAGVSGTVPLSERPAASKMLAELQPGDIVCVAKLDRIFRSTSDAVHSAERFKKRGVKLILCDISVEPLDDSPVGQLFFTVLAAIASFERARIRERILEGKAAKRAKGGHTGGNKPPLGYRVEGKGKEAILVKDEREQEHILEARKLFGEVPGTRRMHRIAEVMASQGMVDRTGKSYTYKSLSRMLARRDVQHVAR